MRERLRNPKRTGGQGALSTRLMTKLCSIRTSGMVDNVGNVVLIPPNIVEGGAVDIQVALGGSSIGGHG